MKTIKQLKYLHTELETKLTLNTSEESTTENTNTNIISNYEDEGADMLEELLKTKEKNSSSKSINNKCIIAVGQIELGIYDTYPEISKNQYNLEFWEQKKLIYLYYLKLCRSY